MTDDPSLEARVRAAERVVKAAQQWRDTDENDDTAMYLACYALQEALMEVENA